MKAMWYAVSKDGDVAVSGKLFSETDDAIEDLRKEMEPAKVDIYDAMDGIKGDVYVMVRNHAKVLYQWGIKHYE